MSAQPAEAVETVESAVWGHLARRVLQDALGQAEAEQWEQAARRMEWAMSRPTDRLPLHAQRPGPGRDAFLRARAERDAELARVAEACRRRAQMSQLELIQRARTCCMMPDLG